MSEFKPKEFVLKNGVKGVIRIAVEVDAEKLFNYVTEVVKDDRFFVLTADDMKQMDITVEKEKERIIKLQQQGCIALVAEIDGNIVGFIDISNNPKKRLKHVGVLAISILEPYRDSGLGSELMKTALAWAKNDETIEKVALAVHTTNLNAQRLYHKFGFVEEGRKMKEIKIGPGQYVDSILMYKFVK